MNRDVYLILLGALIALVGNIVMRILDFLLARSATKLEHDYEEKRAQKAKLQAQLRGEGLIILPQDDAWLKFLRSIRYDRFIGGKGEGGIGVTGPSDIINKKLLARYVLVPVLIFIGWYFFVIPQIR